ncbi:MAG: glycoside hydrolase family 15 protein [Chloroflexi bacterium]|nr:glycoside hydrolase family 15 protein [Chloroflexota bacterium]
MAYKPIRDYAAIGDCHSAALVGLDGSVDWCCFPRFDSPSVFAAILDDRKGGRFKISPRGQFRSRQRYVGRTNVLETSFETSTGSCSLVDCMPIYHGDDGTVSAPHQIIRKVRCEAGTVTLQISYAPRPDYARANVALVALPRQIACRHGAQLLSLELPVDLHIDGGVAAGELRLSEGESVTLVLSYADPTTPARLDDLNPDQRLRRTIDFWEGKSKELTYQGRWHDQVLRSYLVLHLLTYLPTGGFVAAPTTSLPEALGGVRNWDYRYTWLRDASFTIDALMSLGHLDEARGFYRWLARVCTDQAASGELQIMCGVGGERDLTERELSHLEGYRGSRPVRIGNQAHVQFQQDIYGEVLDSACNLGVAGEPLSDAGWELICGIANQAKERWADPGSGIWEVRAGPYHFVYSKVMCWVALDRAVRLAERFGRTGPEVDDWVRTADMIRSDVLARGVDPRKKAFVQHYASDTMDASNLRIPLVGFLPADDPRVIASVDQIRSELGVGPLLRRYLPLEEYDGLPGTEGAFVFCSFWMVQALARTGRAAEARALFERLVGYANHVGLYSEMIDPRTGQFLGNFPQAFTHIGLILAARECEMEPQRDGARNA